MIKFDAFIQAIHAAILSANDTLADKNLAVMERFFETSGDQAASDPAQPSGGLRPKMVTILYPQETASGVVMSEIQVPLITLAPLSMTQISEVKLTTELQIDLQDQDLLVSFLPAQPNDENSPAAPHPGATLEITLTPHHGTEGLKKLVEGYEKVLRSQIP
jgi:hypothetical protein